MGNISAYIDETFWGTVYQSHNPYHAGSIYLHYTLEPDAVLSPELSRELFYRIHCELEKPLQILLNSENTEISAFLEAGGFQRMRRTYCLEVWPACIRFPLTETVELLEISQDSPEYIQCAKLLYQQYGDKHAAINPLTADFPAFCKVLPETVLYQAENGQILHFAFVEENEIAYVGTTEPSLFSKFAAALVVRLFRKNETLYFEADDCDPEAMALKAFFSTAKQNLLIPSYAKSTGLKSVAFWITQICFQQYIVVSCTRLHPPL